MKTFNPYFTASNERGSAIVEPQSVAGLFAERLRQPPNVIRLPHPRKPAERVGNPESLLVMQRLASRQTRFWDSLIFGILASCAIAGIAAALLRMAVW
jgi:hypothetical protein